ncbi:MAG: hypothetical protein ABG776_16840 [Cyanobacteria bacterium J06555_13]
MKLQSALWPILIGAIAYTLFSCLNWYFPGFQAQNIPFLQTAMYLAVAAGLYINVSDIDIDELLKNWFAIAAVLILGVPTKIFVPGYFLSLVEPTLVLPAAFLCATVIAQIDPILAAKNIAHERFSVKYGTILRCWSSFDDPVTVLFAFYIFLPLFLQTRPDFINQFFAGVALEILICVGIALLLRALQLSATVKGKVQKIVVIATCTISALTGKFLLPASLGLVARPFSDIAKERLLNWIFGFSAFLIGALAVGVPLNWKAGAALGVATFFVAQPLVAFLLLRRDSSWPNPNLIRVMAGHQNGMTAILLTIALELRIGSSDLLAITLPAIIAIACFYYLVNYCLERFYLQTFVFPVQALDSDAEHSAGAIKK